MRPEERNSVEALLADYYRCAEQESARLEEAILAQAQPRLKSWIHRETALADPEDARAEVSLRLLNILRRGRQTGEPEIEFFWSYAKTAVTRLVIDAKRREDPRYYLRLRLRYLTTNPRFAAVFARWHLARAEMIGLFQWAGGGFTPTPAYEAFCADDTLFTQKALQGRSPAAEKQVPLPELMQRFLEWIETPLEETPLVAHLVALMALRIPKTVSIDALAATYERDADDLLPAAPQPPESSLNWEACWPLILRLPLPGRRALLMNWSREMLLVATGRLDVSACLCEALEYPAATAQAIYQRLPMEDADIAAQTGITVNYAQVARHRALKALQKGLQGRL